MTDRQILLDMFARRNIKLDTEDTDDAAIFIDSMDGYTAISFDPDGNLVDVRVDLRVDVGDLLVDGNRGSARRLT